jgi:hypothetical protein
MLYLGFKPTIQRKGYYTDGHNRVDVVQYRDDIFLPAMAAVERRMRVYSGENMEEEEMPDLKEGENKAVFIVHDESTFYCCEGQRMMWMEDGKSKILPKTKGTSVMVSGFICA